MQISVLGFNWAEVCKRPDVEAILDEMICTDDVDLYATYVPDEMWPNDSASLHYSIVEALNSLSPASISQPPNGLDAIKELLASDDTGFLQTHSIESRHCLWRVEAPQAKALAIAGDLIFGSLHDVPVAWDCHTGEVVWHAAKSFSPVFHGIATENKVVYANTFGWLQCFEWSQPYVTPAKMQANPQ